MIRYNLLCKKCKYEFDSWFSTKKEFDSINKKNVKELEKIRKKILKYQKFIKENSIYVGDNFVQQARNIHYGKKKVKSIYGNATKKEIKELSEEGIETTTIPWIDISEN